MPRRFRARPPVPAPPRPPLAVSDIDSVAAIAARPHLSLPERTVVLAEKVRLFPPGCRKLLAGGRMYGAVIACAAMDLTADARLDAAESLRRASARRDDGGQSQGFGNGSRSPTARHGARGVGPSDAGPRSPSGGPSSGRPAPGLPPVRRRLVGRCNCRSGQGRRGRRGRARSGSPGPSAVPPPAARSAHGSRACRESS